MSLRHFSQVYTLLSWWLRYVNETKSVSVRALFCLGALDIASMQCVCKRHQSTYKEVKCMAAILSLCHLIHINPMRIIIIQKIARWDAKITSLCRLRRRHLSPSKLSTRGKSQCNRRKITGASNIVCQYFREPPLDSLMDPFFQRRRQQRHPILGHAH